MKKALSGVLMLALTTMGVPMAAAEKAAVESVKAAAPITGALKDAGLKVAPATADAQVVAASSVPVSLPRSGSGRIRKQGVTALVTTLITTAAGAGLAIYMMKELKKKQDEK